MDDCCGDSFTDGDSGADSGFHLCAGKLGAAVGAADRGGWEYRARAHQRSAGRRHASLHRQSGEPDAAVHDHQEAERLGRGAGCLSHLRRRRLPAGWAKCHLPALRLGDLYSVDWRPRGLQSHWCAIACGRWGLTNRYFVADASRKGDSSVAAPAAAGAHYSRDQLFMFLRIVADSFGRRPRHKLLTGAALALGMGVATAALSVSLDVGDRLAKEFRSLGANLLVTPQADSLPLEIGGVDYRPVNAGAYLPEADLPKLKTIFWHNNIIGFSPALELSARGISYGPGSGMIPSPDSWPGVRLIGTWVHHMVLLPDGHTFESGVEKTNPWWQLSKGRWFSERGQEGVVGNNVARKAGTHIIGKSTGLWIGYNFDLYPRHPSNRSIQLKAVGILYTGGPPGDSVIIPLQVAQQLAHEARHYRKLFVSALTKPEGDFSRRDPGTMKPDEFERLSCSPYVSSIAYSIKQVLPGAEVRVVRRVAEGEGAILTRVRMLLWLVTGAALLAAALAVGASSAASVVERRTKIGFMKGLGAGSGTVGFLLAAEQILLAFVGGGAGYPPGVLLAPPLGGKIFCSAL